jgi:hypothetical protein
VATAVAAVGVLAAIVVTNGTSAPLDATTPTSPGPVNPAAVPLGDGYVGSTPKVGYVDSCQTTFSPAAGGSQVDGPWIDTTTKTWNSETKLAVQGSVSWPQASYKQTIIGTSRLLKFNDLPIDHTTGTFPIATSDPAHAYDGNPNHIAAQSESWNLPLDPKAAKKASCVGMGAIGVLDDGVLLYNALDGEGRDAGAHEVLDSCGGHPDQSSTYHHHGVPPCILSKVKNGTTALVGYALDGYGIYVVKNAAGDLPSNTQLDACHGTTSPVMWNGKLTDIYHYVATLEYPYTVGCYHGTPIKVAPPAPSSNTGPPGSAPPGP